MRILLLLLLPVVGMGQVKRPVKGEYAGYYQIETQKAKYDLWEGAIDYLTKSGFTIKSLDKENGTAYVISPDLMPKYTYETKGGDPIDASAYVVLEKIKNLSPKEIVLHLNIRVADNKVICSTSKVEVKSNKPRKTKWRYFYGAKSTGQYEKTITDAINGH